MSNQCVCVCVFVLHNNKKVPPSLFDKFSCSFNTSSCDIYIYIFILIYKFN